ncbi:MAG: sigma-70 family RNA polymerase sigma factor [bacterium]
MKRATVPSMEEAYQGLKPLLFHALARLARQGFPVLPPDALDLIHDFFAEAWSGITTSYDPDKGRLESYVYAAFFQFARPRIARLWRLQRNMLDPLVLTQVMDRESVDTQAPVEIVALRAALDRLPAPQRELLDDYTQGGMTSERAIARRHKLSRYKAKELLIDALAQLIVSLDRPPQIPQVDWEVARALWKDGRTLDETAGYLQLSIDDVRAAAARNLGFLATVMQAYNALNRDPRGRKTYDQPTQHAKGHRTSSEPAATDSSFERQEAPGRTPPAIDRNPKGT